MSEEDSVASEKVMDSGEAENQESIQISDDSVVVDENEDVLQTLQVTSVTDENAIPDSQLNDTDIEKLTFRELKFEDLEQYKKLLKEFQQGFVGILFKEICDNKSGEFYAHGAFTVENQMIGMIIGIRDYVQIRQFTDLETGLAAMTGKKLSHIIALIVDPKFRRNDIGTKLLGGFMKFVEGINTATFLLIPHKNITAQQFFERQQFGALSTLRKFYNEFEDALLFVDKDSNRN